MTSRHDPGIVNLVTTNLDPDKPLPGLERIVPPPARRAQAGAVVTGRGVDERGRHYIITRKGAVVVNFRFDSLEAADYFAVNLVERTAA